MDRGRRSRPPVPLVYVQSFGSHRCGSVIRLGRGCGQSSGQSPGAAPEPQDEPGAGPGRGRVGRPGSRGPVHLREAEAKAHTFDFPIPSRSVNKAIKRKKKKSKVWHRVWKVISKMLEENERFRSRLLACSQLDGEGSRMTQTSQNGAYLDRISVVFGDHNSSILTGRTVLCQGGVYLWLGVARK